MYAYIDEEIKQILTIKRNEKELYFRTIDSWYHTHLQSDLNIMTVTEILVAIKPNKCDEPVGDFDEINLISVYGDTQTDLNNIYNNFAENIKDKVELRRAVYGYINDMQKLLMTWRTEVGTKFFMNNWRNRLMVIFKAQEKIIEEIRAQEKQSVIEKPESSIVIP